MQTCAARVFFRPSVFTATAILFASHLERRQLIREFHKVRGNTQVMPTTCDSHALSIIRMKVSPVKEGRSKTVYISSEDCFCTSDTSQPAVSYRTRGRFKAALSEDEDWFRVKLS